MNNLQDKLTNRLTQVLPGIKAHQQLAPSNRTLTIPTDKRKHHSAINLLLYPQNKQWQTLILKRPGSLNLHSDELCFPGGKFDAGLDKDLQSTAMRETFEETGIQINHKNIIGQLSPLYIPVSEFLVFPFVSLLSQAPQIHINEHEVANYFHLAIEPVEGHQVHTLTRKHCHKTISIPYFHIHGEKLWGASAMIFNEFLTIWKEIMHG